MLIIPIMQFVPMVLTGIDALRKYGPTVIRFMGRLHRIGRSIQETRSGASSSSRWPADPSIHALRYRIRNLAHPPARLQTYVPGGAKLLFNRLTSRWKGSIPSDDFRPVNSFRMPNPNAMVRSVPRSQIKRAFKRRQIRAHYLNPRTKHRLNNAVATRGHRVEARARRFIRRRRLRRLYRRFRRRGYKMGKWCLVGNYYTSVAGTGDSNELDQMAIQVSYPNADTVSNFSGGLVSPLGSTNTSISPSAVAIDSTTYNVWRVYFTPNVHFNIQYATAGVGVNDSLAVTPTNYVPAGEYSYNNNELANVGWGSSRFSYALLSTAVAYTNETQLARMPPVPFDMVRWTADTSNPFSVSDPNLFTKGLPYLCYWNKVYFRINYAFKVSWPDIWSRMTIGNDFNVGANYFVPRSMGSTLPPNPPLYIRLFCVRTLTNVDLERNVFVRAVFPNNAPINSGFTKGYRKNLWAAGKSLIVWHRLWMFNGQITPQFQSSENLSDGEEGHFSLGVRYKTHNLTGYLANLTTFQSSMPALWPSPVQIGYIKFFLFAGFLSPQFFVTFAAPSTVTAAPSEVTIRDALYPSVACHINITADCYPRLMKPNPLLPMTYNTNTQMSYSIMTKGLDSIIKKDELSENELEHLEKNNKIQEIKEENIENDDEENGDLSENAEIEAQFAPIEEEAEEDSEYTE